MASDTSSFWTIIQHDLNHPCVVLVLGIPGAGKGTNCAFIAQHTDFYHLSVGDYLRDLSHGGPGHEKLLGGHLPLMELVNHVNGTKHADPNKIVSIMKIKVDLERANGNHNFLIDGFPRNMAGAVATNAAFNPDYILSFECPEEIAKQRFIGRKRGVATAEKFEERLTRLRPNLKNLIDHYKLRNGENLITVKTNQWLPFVRRDVLQRFAVRGWKLERLFLASACQELWHYSWKKFIALLRWARGNPK